MTDLYVQLIAYAYAMWRKRWYIALIAWLICIPGWIGVMLLPDRFESSARIYVDTVNLLSPLLRGLSVEGNVGNQVDFMQRTLLSRPNVEKLMRMTDLDLAIKTPNDNDLMVADIARRTSISQNQGRNLFSVSFNDHSPEVAQRVVQALLSIFVESNVGASRTDIEKARQFLDVQISQYEKQLQAAEARLAEYKKTHLDILSRGAGGAGGGSFQQALDQAKASRLDIKGQLDDALSKRTALQKQLDSVSPFMQLDQAPQVVINANGTRVLPPTLQAIQTRIDDQQKALDALKLRYTDKHPDVIAANKQLADLQRQYDEAEKKLASGKGDEKSGEGVKSVKSSVPNPLYEQVKLLQVNNEAAISTLE